MNKRYILIVILIILFAVMQTSVFPQMLILSCAPNIVLVFVCVLSYFRGSSEGMITGLIGGLALDFLVGRAIGFYGLIFMVICFIMGFFPRKNIRDNVFIAMAVAMALIFPAELIIYWLKKISIFFSTGMKDITIETGSFILKNILPGILYNCIVFIPVYYIGKRFDRALNKGKKFTADC